MRIGDNLPLRFQNVAVVLWILGLALNFITALSGIWGWHPFLGWASTLVLMIFAYDERQGILKALKRGLGVRDRLFAIYLLSISTVALVANLFLAVYRLQGRPF